MDRQQLYDKIADRKIKKQDFEPYNGNNGRVNKCVNLMRAKKIRVGGVLLDVGGGIGDLGYATRDLFEKTITADISKTNLDAAKAKGNECLLIDIDKQGLLGVDDNSVDVITALDFIEHIIDPENFARECYRTLKPGGEVFINTPNIQFFKHLAELIHEGRFPHTSGDKEVYHGGHLAFFTYNDLCEIFNKNGFTSDEQIKDDEGYINPPSYWTDMLNPKTQNQYKIACMRLGNPNLLYKAYVNK